MSSCITLACLIIAKKCKNKVGNVIAESSIEVSSDEEKKKENFNRGSHSVLITDQNQGLNKSMSNVSFNTKSNFLKGEDHKNLSNMKNYSSKELTIVPQNNDNEEPDLTTENFAGGENRFKQNRMITNARIASIHSKSSGVLQTISQENTSSLIETDELTHSSNGLKYQLKNSSSSILNNHIDQQIE